MSIVIAIATVSASFVFSQSIASAGKQKRVRQKRLVLDKQIFSENTTFIVQNLVIKRGALVRVQSGVHLRIYAKNFFVEGPSKINANGDPGINGKNGVEPAPWTSGPRKNAIQKAWRGEDPAHKNWERAGTHPDDVGRNGTDGTDGKDAGTVVIRYIQSEGAAKFIGRKNSLIVTTSGGKAGRAGKGSYGRRLICGSHANHQKNGPSGRDGRNGRNGRDGYLDIERIAELP